MAITINGSGITSANIADGTITASDISASEVKNLKSGRKNLLINGGFDVWQRGTSTTSTGYRTADRWNISQLSNVDRSTDVPDGEGFKYSLRWQVNSSDPYMKQKLENIMPLIRGKVVTLSFWAKATSGSFSTAQYMETNGGSGGYYAQALGTGESLTSTWTRYSRTFTVSTSHDINAIECGARFDAKEGVGNDIYITGVQLELGSVATDFEHRSFGEELALCQRYYQLSGTTDFFWTGTTDFRIAYPFPVKMRGAPSVNHSTSDYHEFLNVTGYNGFTSVINNWSTSSGANVKLHSSASPGRTPGDRGLVGENAIYFDAEL